MTVALGQEHLCTAPGKTHLWVGIPVEFVPNVMFGYEDIDNERCSRCGRVKALLWLDKCRWVPRYKWNTGARYKLTADERPDVVALRRLARQGVMKSLPAAAKRLRRAA